MTNPDPDDEKKTLYDLLGGEKPLRELVNSFYEHMDQDPTAASIREIHQLDLSEANQKLFEFLSGWLGGPSLFIEKYGHPRLRARHLPFSIGARDRDQWLHCMTKALESTQAPKEFTDIFLPAISKLADHMRNRPESS